MSQNDNDTASTSTPQPPAPAPPSPSLLTMSTFLTNIIDCVARPSTSDSPVRILNSKHLDSSAGSPICISAIPTNESDNNFLAARSSSSTDNLATAAFPVATIEDDDITLNSLEANVRQQFEAAFATFLYKNPAFASMSHGNLTRLRSKLARESAANSRADAELKRQLQILRENKAKNELELQRELLVVTRAKAAREAELRNCIYKLRCESMAIDEEIQRVNQSGVVNGGGSNSADSTVVQSQRGGVPSSPVSPISSSIGDYAASNPLLMMPLTPDVTASVSFQAELNMTRIEYERLNIEIEGLKVLIEGTSAVGSAQD
ncbi:hypothetical protein ACHAXN_006153 [Cyclotella atomus]